MLNRRSFMSSIAALIVFSKSSLSAATVSSDRDQQMLAWDTLRFLVTAQHMNKSDVGNFVDNTRLLSQSVIDKISQHEKAEQLKIGRSLIANLNLNSQEILPGWSLSQVTVKDGFQAVMVQSGSSPQRALATDHNGLVYAGTVNGSFKLKAGTDTKNLVTGSTKLNKPRSPKKAGTPMGSLKGLMAFGFMPAFLPCPKCCDWGEDCECPGWHCSGSFDCYCFVTSCDLPFCCSMQIC